MEYPQEIEFRSANINRSMLITMPDNSAEVCDRNASMPNKLNLPNTLRPNRYLRFVKLNPGNQYQKQ